MRYIMLEVSQQITTEAPMFLLLDDAAIAQDSEVFIRGDRRQPSGPVRCVVNFRQREGCTGCERDRVWFGILICCDDVRNELRHARRIERRRVGRANRGEQHDSRVNESPMCSRTPAFLPIERKNEPQPGDCKEDRGHRLGHYRSR